MHSRTLHLLHILKNSPGKKDSFYCTCDFSVSLEYFSKLNQQQKKHYLKSECVDLEMSGFLKMGIVSHIREEKKIFSLFFTPFTHLRFSGWGPVRLAKDRLTREIHVHLTYNGGTQRC